LWEPLSWFTTLTLVTLGWIFFRANSTAKAGDMLAAIVSPASYASHVVSGSLYLLVIGLALGYVIVLLATQALDRCSAVPDREAAPRGAGIMALLARKRWFWVPPLYAFVLLVVLIVTFTQGASTAQLMYRRF
jgi:hypothetical protein